MAKTLEDFVRTIDQEPVEVVEKPRKQEVVKVPSFDNFGNVPIEDRFGQGLWVTTRKCYCPDDAETDCRFHSVEEKGWEVCPFQEVGRKANVEGRWLYAKNPNYGKTKPEVENVDPTS